MTRSNAGDEPGNPAVPSTTVTVARGAANQARWEFTDAPRQVLRVGSSAHCTLQLQAPGVRSNHLMLVWNGEQLTAVATGAGDVFIDDQPLAGSSVLASCRIRMGDAVLKVRAPAAPRFRRPHGLYREALPDVATVAIPTTAAGDDSAPTAVFRPSRRGRDRDRGEPGAGRRKPVPLAPVASPRRPPAPPFARPATTSGPAGGRAQRVTGRSAKPSLAVPHKALPAARPPRGDARARATGKRSAATRCRWAATSTAIVVRRAQRRLRPYALSLVAAAVSAAIAAAGTLALMP